MIGGPITAHETLCLTSCYFEQLGTSLAGLHICYLHAPPVRFSRDKAHMYTPFLTSLFFLHNYISEASL